MTGRRSRLAQMTVKAVIVVCASWWFSSRAFASTPSNSVSSGADLYATGCSSCHGVDGTGVTTSEGTVRGVNIVDAGAASVYFELSTGRMPLSDSTDQPVRKPPVYDDEEIAALVEYVAAFGHGPPMPSVDLVSADLAAGGELYRANCQACHSASGAGGALSYGDAAPALSHAEPLQVAAALRAGPGQMPVFGSEVIDQNSLNDVVSYVQYLRDPIDRGGAPIGRVGPVPEGFVALTLGIGSLLAFVAWIGTRLMTGARATVRTRADDPQPDGAEPGGPELGGPELGGTA